MEKENKIVVVLSIISGIIFVLGVVASRLFYKLGYCKAFDERSGAREIKPSFRWL